MRIRTIKPEFFTHERLFDAEVEEGLPLRIAFVGLWCAADREGRFKWEPRRLGVSILPFDNVDFSRVLHALTTRGFIVNYASNGVEYGSIPSFHKHQLVNPRERASEIPEPPQVGQLQLLDASATRGARVNHACPTGAIGKGREGKGTRGEDAPISSLPRKDNNGHLSAAERIGLEKEAKEIKTWLKAKQQDNYTAQEAEARRQKKERLTKIEKAIHIPLP